MVALDKECLKGMYYMHLEDKFPACWTAVITCMMVTRLWSRERGCVIIKYYSDNQSSELLDTTQHLPYFCEWSNLFESALYHIEMIIMII